MKKLKNGCHFFNINRTEKFPITKSPKVWVSGFLSVDGNGISALAIMKKTCVNRNGISADTGDANFLFSEFSIGSFYPITHPRLNFNIMRGYT